MTDHCTEMDEPYRPQLRLIPGARGELEINTAIVRRYMDYAPGELVELTALADGGPFVAQVTAEAEHIHVLRSATKLRGFAGAYMLVNGPIDPRLGARYEPNQWHRARNGRAGDKDIQGLRNVFIDCDPIRPKGISSTDNEEREAWDVSQRVEEWIARSLGRECIGHGASGNGFFTLIALEPCAWTPETTAGIDRFLKLVNKRFGSERVKIDSSVANPARLMAAPGTWKKKGRNTLERPHRMTSFACSSRVVRVPLSEVIG